MVKIFICRKIFIEIFPNYSVHVKFNSDLQKLSFMVYSGYTNTLQGIALRFMRSLWNVLAEWLPQ